MKTYEYKLDGCEAMIRKDGNQWRVIVFRSDLPKRFANESPVSHVSFADTKKECIRIAENVIMASA